MNRPRIDRYRVARYLYLAFISALILIPMLWVVSTQWQIFWRVYFPLGTPGMVVLGILAFNYHWNEFFRPLIFLSTDVNFTVPLGIVALRDYKMTGSISVVLAGIILSIIPALIIYLLGQKHLIEGIPTGSLKG